MLLEKELLFLVRLLKRFREKKSSQATFLFWVEMTEGYFLFLEDEGRLSAVPAVALGKSYPHFDRIVRKRKEKTHQKYRVDPSSPGYRRQVTFGEKKP